MCSAPLKHLRNDLGTCLAARAAAARLRWDAELLQGRASLGRLHVCSKVRLGNSQAFPCVARPRLRGGLLMASERED